MKKFLMGIIRFLDRWFHLTEEVEFSNREREFKAFSDLHMTDEWTKISHCGNAYTFAMFSPVTAVMLCLFRTYKTDNLPIYGVRTNVQEIDIKTGCLKVTIETLYPGIIIGEGGKLIDEFKKNIMEIFHVNNVDIDLVEITNIHKPIDNY
jgi:hypothetical protein